MYYYISGTLAHKSTGFAVIDAGGVGYKLTVSQNTYDRLPLSGNAAKLYTYLAVREDGIERKRRGFIVMGSGRLWLFGNNHSKIVHGAKPQKTREKIAKNGDFPRFLMIKQGCVVNTVRFAAGTPNATLAVAFFQVYPLGLEQSERG